MVSCRGGFFMGGPHHFQPDFLYVPPAVPAMVGFRDMVDRNSRGRFLARSDGRPD